MSDDYITSGEFSRWRVEETEFRKDLNSRLDELLRLVRTQNGRVFSQEKQVAIIERRLMAIESADDEIDRTVKDIQQRGCHQYKNHETTLAALEGAGVLPNTTGPPARHPFSPRTWSPRAKVAAGAGVTALVIPAISDLFKLGVALIGWLQQLHGRVP